MKYLEFKKLESDNFSELLKNTESFFAFGKEQFDEKKKEGEKYTSLGGGLIIPSRNVKNFIKVNEENKKAQKKIFLEKVDKKQAIIYELGNYECFYSGELDEVYEIFEEYNIKKDVIYKIFKLQNDKNNAIEDGEKDEIKRINNKLQKICID